MKDPREKQDYKSLIKYSKKVNEQIDEAFDKINVIQTEISGLQDGIYNKPLAIEMQEIYAKAAYLCTSSFAEAALISRVPIKQIHAWVKEKNWDLDKKDHYNKVEMRMKKYLDEHVVDKQAKICTMLWNRVEELLMAELDDNDMHPLDQAKAVGSIIDSALKLQGGQDEKKETPPIQQLANQILINFSNQQPKEMLDKNIHEVIVDKQDDIDNEEMNLELVTLEESLDGK